MKPMPKAMVLAAGLGTRMRPLTDHMPKPLVQVAGVPLIDRVLDWLAASGVVEAVVNSHYFSDMLEAHLASRQSPAIHISREAMVLETGGGVKQALPLLIPPPVGERLGGGQACAIKKLSAPEQASPYPNPPPAGEGLFFVINSDVICLDGRAPALHRLLQAWDDSMDVLLLVHKKEDAVGFSGPGDFFMESDILRRRLESPSAPYVFTGVQLMHPRLFQNAPEGAFSLNVLYNQDMQKDGTLTRARGLLHDGDWLHVGSPEELKQAEEWFRVHGHS